MYLSQIVADEQGKKELLPYLSNLQKYQVGLLRGSLLFFYPLAVFYMKQSSYSGNSLCTQIEEIHKELPKVGMMPRVIPIFTLRRAA
ncbi:hypothetical protein OHJ21_06115 [Virgibacillus sp. LDC1]|nr:hypothetical protein [Virgibacillus sp. LDC1]